MCFSTKIIKNKLRHDQSLVVAKVVQRSMTVILKKSNINPIKMRLYCPPLTLVIA